MARPHERWPLLLWLLCALATVGSFVGARDRATWWMEALPVMAGMVVLPLTWWRFPLTPLLAGLLLVHALILLLGAHYTYAEVPPGFWVRDWLGLERNHYDRLGHFAQGFVPAVLAREILIRHRVVNGRGWLFLYVQALCMAFSAFYEMIEWWAAEALGEDAMAFVGSQGDVWDAQWDMFLATLGALAAQLCLARLHARQLSALKPGGETQGL